MKSSKRLIIDLVLIVGLCFLAIKFLHPDQIREKITATRINSATSTYTPYQGYQADKSFQGVTIVPQAGSAKVLLVNMQGETRKTWDFDAQRVRLLPNCNLLVLHGSKWGIKQPKWKELRDRVREYDWHGNLVWEYKAPNAAHHDLQRLANGNTLFLYRLAVPNQLKHQVTDPIRRKARIRTDGILEVNPKGELVWDWYYHNHFSPNSCGLKPCPPLDQSYGKGKKFVDWTHSNTVAVIPENKWFDQGDQRFRPGNIIVLPRNWSTVFIIDKQTKKIVWSYTGNYKGGLSGGHEANMIPKDLPGAGNMLIFDNGRETRSGASYALEVNPVTKAVAWVFDAGRDFFSHAAGALQRLPNGNTLISEDVPGRIFEITTAGEIVWQYQSDIRTCRAKRYAYDYCPELSKYR